MTSQPAARQALILGTSLLALAVLIGAFGAHGLKALVTPERLVTFETGVRYHFYHAFGILALSLLQPVFGLRTSVPLYAFLAGILLFSFNCYFYVLTDLKVFAMIVPVGGVLFVVGWVALAVAALKLR